MADNQNIKNEESVLFKRLTRLFSGPIVNKRQQNRRKYKRKALDNYATRFTSASGKQFQKSQYNPFEVITSDAMSNRIRNERYVDLTKWSLSPLLRHLWIFMQMR